MLSVPLHYQGPLAPASVVEFRREELSARQSRHKGRYTLMPRLKLDDYRCKAVIDFVEVEIITARNTDYKALRRWVSEGLGLSSIWCEPVGGSVNSASQFHLCIYDPKISNLLRLEEILEMCVAGLLSPVKLRRLEVSVDFYPRSGSENDRLSIVGVLQRTYLPPPGVWERERAHPRFTWGPGKSSTAFFLPSSSSKGLNHLVVPEHSFLDSTVYYGEKDAAWLVRIQNKISDQRTGSSARMLNQSEKRARIEVTLAGSKLAALKLNTISDLAAVSFSTLQREFFYFALPTFLDSLALPHLQCVQEEINRREHEQFRRGGVACVERLRDVKEQWLAAAPNRKTGVKTGHLRVLRDRLRKKGIVPADRRTGQGPRGTAVAFAELNDMIRSALRDLERRIRGGEKRS